MALAALAPLATYGVLSAINLLLKTLSGKEGDVMQTGTIILTSIFLNLFIFIPYIRKEKYERTGRGVMLVTFVAVVVYFLFQI